MKLYRNLVTCAKGGFAIIHCYAFEAAHKRDQVPDDIVLDLVMGKKNERIFQKSQIWL